MNSSQSLLSNIAIVLVRPKRAENIGAAARIACNMGITQLILVADEPPPHGSMAKMATHKAVQLIEQLKLYHTLESALSNFSVVVGTTARKGRQRRVEQGPKEIATLLTPLLQHNQVALVFGPEDTGLKNEDLLLCNYFSAIPTADFSSINLAQAVAIHVYELYQSIIHAPKPLTVSPQLATSYELESMYEFLEDSLYTFSFLEDANHLYWMSQIRRFFAKMQLTPKDANIVRTICKKYLQSHSENKQ